MKLLKDVRLKRLLFTTGLIISFIGIFIYGVGVGRYDWFPFQYLSDLNKGILFKNEIEYQENDELLLMHAFERPIIESELLYEPVKSLEDIYRFNKSIKFSYKEYFNAFDDIKVTSDDILYLDKGETVVKKLGFDLKGEEYEAHSYNINGNEENNTAVLLIPGSGSNQSSEIYSNDPNNYHYGLIDLLKKRGYHIYIYIKPNQDILAWHNNRQKIDGNTFLLNWHLNQGSSYSAFYLAESLAYSKYLKNKYENFIIAGLSQGGLASLLTSLQSEPNLAIISSGYSVTFDSYEWAGHGQIIIPGLFDTFNSNKIFSIMNNQKTDYFFSYGSKEIGTYRLEAENRTTCIHFDPLTNVRCVIHDQGHVFPIDEIEMFLNDNN